MNNIDFAQNNKGRRCYSLPHKIEGIIIGHCIKKYGIANYIVIFLDDGRGISAKNDNEYEYSYYYDKYNNSTAVVALAIKELFLFDEKIIIDLINKLEL